MMDLALPPGVPTGSLRKYRPAGDSCVLATDPTPATRPGAEFTAGGMVLRCRCRLHFLDVPGPLDLPGCRGW